MRITNDKQISVFYQALLDKNPRFVGIFFVAVKTTSIFCIATCRARKPKKENVVFYTSFKEALDHGYSPCKICKPTENTNQTPEIVAKAIQLIKENPKKKISDFQLKQQKISPEIVRRWFKKTYGITFQAYQRMYRINHAFQELKTGKSTIDTAFDTGYESLSGFAYTFKKLMGKSPAQSQHENIILINRLTTPLGPMFICATDDGVCLLEFVDRRMLETEFKDLQNRLKTNIILGENTHIKQAKKEIQEYFEGTRTGFEVKLTTPGTDFQKTVWRILQTIEYATTTTYQEQALAIANPKAVRAVASANGIIVLPL